MAANAARIALVLTLAGSLIVLPVVLARHMLATARTAVLSKEPNYLSHTRPSDDSKDPLPSRLKRLLRDDMRSTQAVPRIFMTRLPDILPTERDVQTKKRLFTSTLLPIILRANEMLLTDRARLQNFKTRLMDGGRLLASERDWLDGLAARYRVPLGDTPLPAVIDRLLVRVDIIPPSLALAQAAMESGWGTSYFSQKGNALFGEWVWNDDTGLLPRNRDEGKTHRIKRFDYLLDSVLSYMINLNRHRVYHDLRLRRAELRTHNLPVTGRALAPALGSYSERGSDYVSEVLSIINYNQLDRLDYAQLASG